MPKNKKKKIKDEQLSVYRKCLQKNIYIIITLFFGFY